MKCAMKNSTNEKIGVPYAHAQGDDPQYPYAINAYRTSYWTFFVAS